MSYPISNHPVKIIDQSDFIVFQTRAFFSIAWSIVAWALLALDPYIWFVFIPMSFAAKLWGIIAAAVLVSLLVLWFPFAVSAASYKLSIDLRDKTYKLIYGILPLRFLRNGPLSDFARVEVWGGRYSPIVGLIWRDLRLPFRTIGSGLGVASYGDKHEAQIYGERLAGRLGLPFAVAAQPGQRTQKAPEK